MTDFTLPTPAAEDPAGQSRTRRLRAVAAALAAGGVASLGVVLLGSPSLPGPHPGQVVATPVSAEMVPVARRADVTLGETW